MRPVIELSHIDLVFGPKPRKAFNWLDEGYDSSVIFQKLQHTVAVRNLSLKVHAGETIVIMGLSGSGKSSLLRCINGLNGRRVGTGALRGKVEIRLPSIGATDLVTCHNTVLQKLRTQGMAMVFQQAGLLPWKTVLDNVALPLELQGVAPSQRKFLADEKLSIVGLDGWGSHYPHELSGGMQQRVGLARALVTDCPILLMDEPFSALDPLIREQLQTELLSLRQKLGKTIVFVTHDMGEALRLGTRIVIMESGEILQQGTPVEIMSSPNSSQVARFLAHANPLAALTGEALMIPFKALSETSSGFDLDGTSRYFCQMNERGEIKKLKDQQHTLQLIRAYPERDRPGEEHFVAASASSTLGELISNFQSNRRPLILLDSDGYPAGVLSEREIIKGLMNCRIFK